MNQRTPVWKTTNKIERQLKNKENKLKKTEEKIQQLEKLSKGQKPGRIPLKDKKRRKNKEKLKKKKQEKKKLKKEIKEINKKLGEYEYYNNKISEIFTYDTVEKEFNRIYNQLDFLPEEIAKFIKNLKKDFDKTINHIKRNDIPKTNNLLEGFFKITFPKKYKRRFRTEQGVKNYLRHMRIRWYEHNVLHEKIKI